MTISSGGAREGRNGRERHTKRVVPLEIAEQLTQQDGKARVYAPDLKVSPVRMERILEEEAQEKRRKESQAKARAAARATADKRKEANDSERREMVNKINELHLEKARLEAQLEAEELQEAKRARSWFARFLPKSQRLIEVKNQIEDIMGRIRALERRIKKIDIDHKAYFAE